MAWNLGESEPPELIEFLRIEGKRGVSATLDGAPQ